MILTNSELNVIIQTLEKADNCENRLQVLNFVYMFKKMQSSSKKKKYTLHSLDGNIKGGYIRQGAIIPTEEELRDFELENS